MISPTPVPEPRPGYLSSEFWLGVIAQGLVWYEAINPSFRVTPGQQAKLTLAAGAVSLLATAYYTFSRKQVKTAHQEATANVAVAAIAAAGPMAVTALSEPLSASIGALRPVPPSGLPASPYEALPQAEKRTVKGVPMRSGRPRRLTDAPAPKRR